MGTGALEGVKVADFTWVAAGPIITKYLAENGATIIRIESMTSPDLLRTAPPRRGNHSGFFSFFNCNKYSMAINLNHDKGPEVAKKVVAWSDIVVDNFTAGPMKRWGLDYESLVEIKPDIVMLEANIHGQTGPHARRPGFGVMAVSLTGITHFTGWPDRNPVTAFGGYTDLIIPRYAAATLLAALDYRNRTGKGVYMDFSQMETATQFIAPSLLEYTANGRESQRTGNECPYAAPHGAYRCLGDDRWCVISVMNDEEWQSFTEAIGQPEWTMVERFSTLLGRKKHEQELDRLVEQWTVCFTAEDVMVKLQAAGVSAGVVQSPADLIEDPHLKERQHFWVEDYRDLGMFHYNGPAYRLSKSPSEFKFSPTDIGESTEYVCKEILKMTEDEFVDYLLSGVFE